jgi:hypothetical protein
VDLREKGRGLGKALLKDAILRTLRAADIAGLKAIFVQAKDEDAQRFNVRHGSITLPGRSLPALLPARSVASVVWRKEPRGEAWDRVGVSH